jgi:hypothetical protein
LLGEAELFLKCSYISQWLHAFVGMERGVGVEDVVFVDFSP